MNKMVNIIAAGTAGTTAMTAFSYWVSEKKNKQFREPELLGQLFKRVVPRTTKSSSKVAGWILHYAVGYVFTAAYSRLWNRTKASPSLMNGVLIGGASGVGGAAVWETVFSMHPRPPKIQYGKYYAHLVLAHMIFGATAALVYKTLKR